MKRCVGCCSFSTSLLFTSPPLPLVPHIPYVLSVEDGGYGDGDIEDDEGGGVVALSHSFISQLHCTFLSGLYCKMKMTVRPCELGGRGGHCWAGGCVGCYHQCHPGHLGPTGLRGPPGFHRGVSLPSPHQESPHSKILPGSWGASCPSTIPGSTAPTDAV